MNIGLQIWGSEGDIRPLLGLGYGLFIVPTLKRGNAAGDAPASRLWINATLDRCGLASPLEGGSHGK